VYRHYSRCYDYGVVVECGCVWVGIQGVCGCVGACGSVCVRERERCVYRRDSRC